MADLATLIAELSGAAPEQRAAAAERLASLGEQAQAAAVPLVRATADSDEGVRNWATSALEDLGPPAATDGAALAELLADDSEDIGYWAATLLGRLADARHVDALAAALAADRPLIVRQRSCWALGQIGPPAQAARSSLEQAAASDDRRLARLAQAALERLSHQR